MRTVRRPWTPAVYVPLDGAPRLCLESFGAAEGTVTYPSPVHLSPGVSATLAGPEQACPLLPILPWLENPTLVTPQLHSPLLVA